MDSGKTLKFTGYPSEPYSDMLFYPSTSKSTKTFEFSLKKQEQTSLHTFQGFGLWINSKIEGEYPSQKISGYLLWISLEKTYVYEINSIDISSIRQNFLIGYSINNIFVEYLQNMTIHGLINESALGSASIDEDVYYKIEVKENSLRLWRSNNHITDDSSIVNWELDSNKPWMSELYIENKYNAYGFGPMMQYSGHACALKTVVSITDLVFPVTLTEDVVEEPKEEVEEPKEEEEKPPLTCADAEYEKKNHCSCKKLACNEDFPKDCIGKFIYDLYQIIKIGVTILLVVLTIMDFVKAMVASDETAMKKNVNIAIKRVIIVVILLFGPALINFFLGLISGGKWSTCGIR